MAFWDKGNKFPYTNNHDANLDYMMSIFENIKNEWHDLYVDLVEWKGTTTLELNTWKTNALAQIEQYETDFRAEIAVWKANTEQDIGVWEQSVLADLGTWRANFETLFATTFSNLSQIKTDAEAARDAAALSAEAAEDSADEAAASAESVSDSLAQIAQNTADVADLKTQINKLDIESIINPIAFADLTTVDGYYIVSNGKSLSASPTYITYCYHVLEAGNITIKATKSGNYYTLFRVSVTDSDLTTLTASTTADIKTVAEEVESTFAVSSGDYVNFTIYCTAGDTPSTAYNHFVVGFPSEDYYLPTLIVEKEQVPDLENLTSGTGMLAIQIPANTSANDLQSNATLYSFGNSNTPSNIPSGIDVGNIINFHGANEYRRVQILSDNEHGVYYIRSKYGDTWGDWLRILSKDEGIASFEEKKNVKLTKTSATEFNIKVPCKSGNVVRYDFKHDYKSWESLEYTDGQGQTAYAQNVVSADYWNNYYVYNDTTDAYIAQGNTNMICRMGNHFSGDGHGNEVNASFDILADGKPISLDSLAVNGSVSCGELRIIAKTKLYQVGGNTGSDIPSQAYPALDTNGNPIVQFVHYIEISYQANNHVVIDNKIIVQQNNTVFTELFGAMLENNFGDFSKFGINNTENTQNNIDDSGNVTVTNGSEINLKTSRKHVANVGEMYGKNHYIRQSMEVTHGSTADKLQIECYFYNNRLKMYFAPVYTELMKPSGASADTFNTGDAIAVRTERIIEI